MPQSVSGTAEKNDMTDVAKDPSASDASIRLPPGLADDRREPALSAQAPAPDPPGPPPPPLPAAPDRPEELAPPMPPAGMADETGNASRFLQRVLERIPQAETAIFKHIDERLAELPAEIERRLTAPPRRDAPPEADPNLLERIAAQAAETETNLAKFIEMRTGRLETAADKFAADSLEAATPPEAADAAALEDVGQTVVQASEAATADVVPPVAEAEPAGQAASPANIAAAAAKLEKQIRTHAADFRRWQSVDRTRSRRLAIAAVAFGAPCLLALGLFLQTQFAILPVPDPTNGWRDLVWNRYGAEIANCVLRARTAGKQTVCEIVVP